MHKWGMEEAVKANSVEPKNLWWKRWCDGRVIAKTRYKPDFEKNFGVPYRVIHRAHLHEALHNKAVELGVKIHLGRTVASYDPDRPSMRFTNGEEVYPDLLVAADGETSHGDVHKYCADCFNHRLEIDGEAGYNRRTNIASQSWFCGL